MICYSSSFTINYYYFILFLVLADVLRIILFFPQNPKGIEITKKRLAGEMTPNKPKMAMYLHATPRAIAKM